MDCEKTEDLIWQMHEGELDGSLAAELREHIASCPQCAEVARVARQVDLHP